MTRFEISGTVVDVVHDDFYVSSDTSVLRVPIRQDQDRPKIGAKVTIAVEVH